MVNEQVHPKWVGNAGLDELTDVVLIMVTIYSLGVLIMHDLVRIMIGSHAYLRLIFGELLVEGV